MCAYTNFGTMASMKVKNPTLRAANEISLANELLIGSLFQLIRHQLTPNQILALEDGDDLILVLEMMDLLFPSRAGDANAALLSEYCGVEI